MRSLIAYSGLEASSLKSRLHHADIQTMRYSLRQVARGVWVRADRVDVYLRLRRSMMK